MTGNEHNFKVGDNVIITCNCNDCVSTGDYNSRGTITEITGVYYHITLNNDIRTTYSKKDFKLDNSHIIKTRLGVK